jgi:hypothetical protein
VTLVRSEARVLSSMLLLTIVFLVILFAMQALIEVKKYLVPS